MQRTQLLTLIMIVTFILGCNGSSSSSSSDGDSEGLLDADVKLSSTNLAAATKLGGDDLDVLLAQSDEACSETASSCTPTNLEGRIFSGGAMLGELGEGAFQITMLGATDDIILDPSSGIGGTLEFSLIDSTVLSGKYAVPSEEDMPDPPIITRMEFSYDYLDATFTLENTAGGATLDKTFTIRTVFVTEATADDVSGTMSRGDKLIKTSEETTFRWCNSSGCAATRTDVAEGLIQESKLVDYEFPGQGNPEYIPFSVPISPSFTVTYEELTAEGNVWVVDFDMTGAIVFATTPDALSTEPDLLASFELSYEPDQNNAGQETEISATLAIQADSGGAGVAQPTEEEGEEGEESQP